MARFKGLEQILQVIPSDFSQMRNKSSTHYKRYHEYVEYGSSNKGTVAVAHVYGWHRQHFIAVFNVTVIEI